MGRGRIFPTSKLKMEGKTMKPETAVKLAALSSMLELGDDEKQPAIPNDVMAVKLKDALKDLQPTKFKAGDFITLKDKSSPYRVPRYGDIAIVVEVYEPVDWRLPTHEKHITRDDTLVLVNLDGNYLFVALDSRYFKKAEI